MEGKGKGHVKYGDHQNSTGSTVKGACEGPQASTPSHDSGSFSSILSRTKSSAWDLARGMFNMAGEALLEDDLAVLQSGIEKGQSSSGRSSDGHDLLGGSMSSYPASESSSRGSVIGSSSSSLRDVGSNLSSGSLEAEEDYRSFLGPVGGTEQKWDPHNWIANYNSSKSLSAGSSHPTIDYGDGAEVVSLLNDPGFIPLEEQTQTTTEEQLTSAYPGKFFLNPVSSDELKQRGHGILLDQPEDGADVISILADPDFSPMFDGPSIDIKEDDDTLTTDLLIPPASRAVLNNLKLSLPAPPSPTTHRSLPATNPLNLCFPYFTNPIPEAEAVYDQWLEVNRRYMEDVWLDENLLENQSQNDAAAEEERGHEHARDRLRNGKDIAVERLRLTLAHLARSLPHH